MMPGSKVHFLFLLDFCKLFGQDNQRPNQENWDAMSLDEQQAFIRVMSQPPVVFDTEDTGVDIADDGTVTPLPGNDIVPDGQGGAVVVPVVDEELLSAPSVESLPVEPLVVDGRIYAGGGNTPIVPYDQIPTKPDPAIVAEVTELPEPFTEQELTESYQSIPAADLPPVAPVVEPPAELPVDGDLGSNPLV